jgi:hypothetical protein
MVSASEHNWLDCLVDASPIRAIFGDDIPSLRNVNLHQITLNRDGPSVLLRFDLIEFPTSPPKKWKTSGFNCVQLVLMLIGVQRLSIAGWNSNCRCDLTIFRENQYVIIRSETKEIAIDFLADNVTINNISAYCNQCLN